MNETIYIHKGSVNNTYRPLYNYDGPNLNLTIDGVKELIIWDPIETLMVHNALPWIKYNAEEKIKWIHFENITEVRDVDIYNAMQLSSMVQINGSDIQSFSDEFLRNISNLDSFNLTIINSWWSCDCSKTSMLKLNLTGLTIICRVPFKLQDRAFSSLSEEELTCTVPTHPRAHPVKAIEYQSTSLRCAATGYPLPTIVWYSPGGQRLDREFLNAAAHNETTKIYRDTYSINELITDDIVPSNSHLQSVLHVNNVNKRTAGKYICKVANIIDIECNVLYKLFKFFIASIQHIPMTSSKLVLPTLTGQLWMRWHVQYPYHFHILRIQQPILRFSSWLGRHSSSPLSSIWFLIFIHCGV